MRASAHPHGGGRAKRLGAVPVLRAGRMGGPRRPVRRSVVQQLPAAGKALPAHHVLRAARARLDGRACSRGDRRRCTALIALGACAAACRTATCGSCAVRTRAACHAVCHSCSGAPSPGALLLGSGCHKLGTSLTSHRPLHLGTDASQHASFRHDFSTAHEDPGTPGSRRTACTGSWWGPARRTTARAGAVVRMASCRVAVNPRIPALCSLHALWRLGSSGRSKQCQR